MRWATTVTMTQISNKTKIRSGLTQHLCFMFILKIREYVRKINLLGVEKRNWAKPVRLQAHGFLLHISVIQAWGRINLKNQVISIICLPNLNYFALHHFTLFIGSAHTFIMLHLKECQIVLKVWAQLLRRRKSITILQCKGTGEVMMFPQSLAQVSFQSWDADKIGYYSHLTNAKTKGQSHKVTTRQSQLSTTQEFCWTPPLLF